MPGKDDEAAELEHAEEVGFLMFPAVTSRRKLWSQAKRRSIFQRRQ